MASPVSLIPHIFPQVEGLTTLDIGCGEGLYGFLIRNLWYQTKAAEKFPKQKGPKYIIGLDVERTVKNSIITKNIYD